MNLNNYIHFINQTQETIVKDESRIILINGCAGSRKTDTIIKKGINHVLTNKKNIMFLTFVSSVSNEIKNRIEQTLNIIIHKIGSSNHFLCNFNSNYIEIANIDAWIHKQISWIETNIIMNDILNRPKLVESKGKNQPINFNSRVLLLKKYTELYNFYDVVLKNDMLADVIIIDEFQDTDMEKVELIVMLVKNNPNLHCVVAGDILQTIFVNNIGSKNFINPINFFKDKLDTKYYEINTCFRCPSPHINFVNYLLGEKYKKYGLDLMISHNNDFINKPVLFGHDCISKNDTSYKLAQSISNTIIKIIQLDPEIKPDDVAIIMKKSNSNFVFEHIKNILPKLYKKHNINSNQIEINSHLIHFETSGDGYTNSINWDKAINKTVLISIHGDKGKGHKLVFFLGLSNKSIPSDYNIDKDFEIIDISLLNVALTRSLKYLFIGFTFVSPSIYLSHKHKELNNYCYLAWNKNILSELNKNKLYVYSKAVEELNKYWFDNLKNHLKNPNFNTNKNNYKLPIKLNLNVRQDISKDIVDYIDKLIPNLVIEEDCVDIYKQIDTNNIPEPFYKIFGFIGELLLERMNMIKINKFGIFEWMTNATIFYTNSDDLLNIIYDYKLNHFINDLSSWKDKVIEIEFEIIMNDSKNIELIDFFKKIENVDKPYFVLNDFYSKYDVGLVISDFCSNITNEEFCSSTNDINNIILIALIYAELNCEIRRDFIYSMIELIINPNINKIIKQIVLNVHYVWNNLINSNNSNNIYFQKYISIEKNIKSKNILKHLGFNYKNDKNIYKNGLKIGIKGICDLITYTDNNLNANLFEIKTCLKTSFSNEWVLQIAIYNILLKFIDNVFIETNFIINLFDGTIYKIDFKSDILILKNILKLYDFDEYLIEMLFN